MFMAYYVCPDSYVFEAVSPCPYVAIISYVDVNVLPLCRDSKHPTRVRGVFLLTQQRVHPYVCYDSSGNRRVEPSFFLAVQTTNR